jgi:hypothetical protein
MSVLLWWALASVFVSVFVGAFLSFGRRELEVLDLDLSSPELPEAAAGKPRVDSR